MGCTLYPWPQEPPPVLQDSRNSLQKAVGGWLEESWCTTATLILRKLGQKSCKTCRDDLTNQSTHSGSSQEPPGPPRLQEKTWRTGRVLMPFHMANPHQTFTDHSEDLCGGSPTKFIPVSNLQVLQDSRKRLGGQSESWCLLHLLWHFLKL